MVLASAVKWAEMAANYENSRNLKKIFAPVWPYYVAIWYLKFNFLSDLTKGTQVVQHVTAQNLPILPFYEITPLRGLFLAQDPYYWA